jgi:hypothetical protein
MITLHLKQKANRKANKVCNFPPFGKVAKVFHFLSSQLLNESDSPYYFSKNIKYFNQYKE